MIRSINLPVFQDELVDGGLYVKTSNIISDVIVVIGFHANGYVGQGLTPQDPNNYINIPINITNGQSVGDAADYVYGTSPNGSTISQAVYETTGAGANQVYAMTLGQWGNANFVDPATGTSYPLFTNNGNGTYSIIQTNYYMALDNAYTLLAGFNSDIIYPADAFAFNSLNFIPNNTAASGRPTNFAYQLAQACSDMSFQQNECFGVINMIPAASGTLQGVATYIGTAPTTNPATGAILTSGTGLLSMPYMVGAPSGVPAYTILPGFWGSNFPVTSANYGLPPLNKSEVLLDRKGNQVDLGKFIDIVAEEPTYSNAAFQAENITTYNGLGASAYAGLISTLVPQNSATNKVVNGLSGLRYFKSLHQLDLLDGARYITFRNTNRGVVVTDDPTAARPSSDFARRSTMRIVSAVMKLVRLVSDPYIGEANNAAAQNALHSAIDAQLKSFVSQGALNAYDFSISSSPTDAVLGNIYIYLTLVPAFEIHNITAIVVLQSSINS